MRAFLTLISILGMLAFAFFGVTAGPSTTYSVGFLICLVGLVLSVGSLGSKQGGGRLNKSRPKQFGGKL